MAVDEIDGDGWTPDYKSQGDKLDLFWTRGEKLGRVKDEPAADAEPEASDATTPPDRPTPPIELPAGPTITTQDPQPKRSLARRLAR